jgi:hypothetical protein
LDELGNVKFEQEIPNTITELMDAHVADQMSDSADAAIGFMALGSGIGQTSASTDLANYITASMIALSGTGPVQGAGAADNDVVYSAYWGAGVATGSIREAGIFRASGTTRDTLMTYNDGLTVNKGASDTFKIDWTVTFGAS